MGARIGGGGGRVSFRPSTPPPLEKNNSLSGGLFLLLVLHVGVFLHRDHFLASHPPPPLRTFLRAPNFRI